MIDLHMHSNCSDGVQTPEQLIDIAKQLGISTIALSDHDTVAGVVRAHLDGNQHGVKVIPAVELSVCHQGYTDIHLLGYGIDITSPTLTERLDEFAYRRANRNREIIQAVNQVLVTEGKTQIQADEVEELAGGVIGRPHIARTLIKYGHASNMEDAFNRYLVPCDVPKAYWNLKDALKTIQQIGGVAVLAHPTSITKDQKLLTELISELKELGLDGIEVFNSLAYEHEMFFLQKLAQKLDLLITGGSDYHGISPDDCMGKGRGGIHFSDALLPPLLSLAAHRNQNRSSR